MRGDGELGAGSWERGPCVWTVLSPCCPGLAIQGQRARVKCVSKQCSKPHVKTAFTAHIIGEMSNTEP